MIKSISPPIFSIGVVLLLSFAVEAQENNYWAHNYGAGSFLKGGIEVGGIRSGTAIYYNPGALAFLKGEFFEAQADMVGLDFFNIENGAGEDIPITSMQADAIPSVFVYSRENKKTLDFVYSISILTKSNSNITYTINHDQNGDILSSKPGNDIYFGSYSYKNRAKENWFIGAFSFRLGEKVGIGMSTNILLRIQDFYRSYNAEVVPQSEANQGNINYSEMATVNFKQQFDHRSLGIVFKPGLKLDFGKITTGITLTLPNIPLGILRNQASRKEYSLLPDISEDIRYLSSNNDHFSSTYKTPLSIATGFEYFFSKSSLAFALAWFSKINSYELIRANNESITFGNASITAPKYAYPLMAHKSVINFGVAYTHKISEKLYYAGSFRTDFNFFNDEALNRNTDFVPYMSYWDIYHITSGFFFVGGKTEISFGINYGLGLSEGDSQLVNMTTPTQQNRLIGEINNNTFTQYHNLGFVLGLNYTIDTRSDKKND